MAGRDEHRVPGTRALGTFARTVPQRSIERFERRAQRRRGTCAGERRVEFRERYAHRRRVPRGTPEQSLEGPALALAEAVQRERVARRAVLETLPQPRSKRSKLAAPEQAVEPLPIDTLIDHAQITGSGAAASNGRA